MKRLESFKDVKIVNVFEVTYCRRNYCRYLTSLCTSGRVHKDKMILTASTYMPYVYCGYICGQGRTGHVEKVL